MPFKKSKIVVYLYQFKMFSTSIAKKRSLYFY